MLTQVPGGVFAAFAEDACPLRSNLCERVTDGTRTRALRSHNPSEHVLVCPTPSPYVVYLSRKPDLHVAGRPDVSGCVIASIAAALLPYCAITVTSRVPTLYSLRLFVGLLFSESSPSGGACATRTMVLLPA